MERLKRVTIVHREKRGYVVEYRDENGKRPRPAFKTKEQAEAFALQLTGRVRIFATPTEAVDGISIKDAVKKYFAYGNTLTPRGVKTAKTHIECLALFLVNACGLETINSAKLEHLDAFKAHELKRGLSPNSVRRAFATYSAFFNKLLAWGLIAKNPMTGFKKPQEIEADIKVWTPEQVRDVCELLPKWAKDVVLFLERTGLRPVDVERLKWSDFDAVNATVGVYSFKGGQSRREVVNLPIEVIGWLRPLRKNRLASDLVFVTNKGNPVTADSLQETVRRSAEKLGFGGLTVYGLRHTFADSLVNMGIHARDIQLLMRHKKFETTTRYTKRKNDHLKSIVEMRSQVVTNNLVTKQVTKSVEDVETEKTANHCQDLGKIGAGERARTVDLYLGKKTVRIA
jgi:integrase/recombinase XerC